MVRDQRVAVIGSGTMGSGIALAAAQAGLDVILHDIDAERLEKAVEMLRGKMERRVAKGKMTQAFLDGTMERLGTSTDLDESVGEADLVIEAVFEDLDVKRKVFQDVDAAAPEGCIIATNTSSLRVTDLAEATKRPDQVVGLHFFFPAHVNQLVEVVPTADTDPDAMAKTTDLVRAMGKVPIRTTDSSGFCVNRFFVPWVNEAVRLLDEGVADIPTIDAAAKEAFEIGMGPFQLMNATGVPISLHAQRTLHDAFGEFYEPAAGLVKQVEDLGEDWDLEGDADPTRFEAVAARLQGVAWGIAAQLVQEGVCTAVDTDKGAVVGLRWAQGPFRMMNDHGLKEALAKVEAIHEQWGDAFPVADLLRAHAGMGEPFVLPKVKVEREGGIAILTIQRPGAMNALNSEVLTHLRDALQGIEDVHAAIITGEGNSFVAGADIREMAEMGTQEALDYMYLGHDVLRLIEDLPVPVIAAMNGFALGGGLELALACDARIVAEEATVGLPEVTLGLIPGFGGTTRLPRLIGPERARVLLLSGRRLTGAESVQWGMCHRALPRSEVLPAAKALAKDMARNAPLAMAAAKRVLTRTEDAPLADALAIEAEEMARLFSTEDQTEGLKAFIERRPPEWKGA